MKIFKYNLYLFFCLSFLILINILYVNAQLTEEMEHKMIEQEVFFADKAGLDSAMEVDNIIGRGIKTFLGLLGMIFIILMLVAGYYWMTASGDEEKVNKAKVLIKRAIIGLVIIVAAYAITYFVFSNLPPSTNPQAM